MAPSETRVFSSGIAVVMDVDLGAPSGRPKPVVVWFQKGYRSSSALNLDDLLVAQRTAWPGNTAPRLRFRIVRINDETNKDLLASLDGAGSVARALAVGTGNAALLPVGTTGAYVVVGHARAAPPDLALNATVDALSQRYATRLGNANSAAKESRAKVLADLAADARFLGVLDRYAAKPGVPQLLGVLEEIRTSSDDQIKKPTDGLKTALDLVLRGTGCRITSPAQAARHSDTLASAPPPVNGRLPNVACPSQAAHAMLGRCRTHRPSPRPPRSPCRTAARWASPRWATRRGGRCCTATVFQARGWSRRCWRASPRRARRG
jgi:hypothetical protein